MLPTLPDPIVQASAPEALHWCQTNPETTITVWGPHVGVRANGDLYYRGPGEPLFDRVQLGGVARGQLEVMVRFPGRGYGERIDADHHAFDLSRLLAGHERLLTLVVQRSINGRPGVARAILSGSRDVPGFEKLLSALAPKQQVTMGRGRLRVDATHGRELDLGLGESFRLSGYVHAERWRERAPTRRAEIDIGLFMTRLVCSNGMYARRSLRSGRRAWAEDGLSEWIDDRLQHAMLLPAERLARTMNRMRREEAPNDLREHTEVLIQRAVPAAQRERIDPEDRDGMAYWDVFNRLTNAANFVDGITRRDLQVRGGSLLEAQMALD